jgi:hypothetical protein
MKSLYFQSTLSFQPHCGRGVDSASNRNEHQEYFRGKWLPVSKADLTIFFAPIV